MIRKKISFQHMESSAPLENHVNDKLKKVEEILRADNMPTPIHIEVFLTANSLHPHHNVEINLKTPHFDLNAHDKNVDMYVAFDNSVDKLITQYHKSKKKFQDKIHKPKTDKKAFADDSFSLGDDDETSY